MCHQSSPQPGTARRRNCTASSKVSIILSYVAYLTRQRWAAAHHSCSCDTVHRTVFLLEYTHFTISLKTYRTDRAATTGPTANQCKCHHNHVIVTSVRVPRRLRTPCRTCIAAVAVWSSSKVQVQAGPASTSALFSLAAGLADDPQLSWPCSARRLLVGAWEDGVW